MGLSEDLRNLNSLFLDTAPVIYYIQAHPEYGPLAREVVKSFQRKDGKAYTSVLTLTEVLTRPLERGSMDA